MQIKLSFINVNIYHCNEENHGKVSKGLTARRIDKRSLINFLDLNLILFLNLSLNVRHKKDLFAFFITVN